jgi:hypothetical protein
VDGGTSGRATAELGAHANDASWGIDRGFTNRGMGFTPSSAQNHGIRGGRGARSSGG